MRIRLSAFQLFVTAIVVAYATIVSPIEVRAQDDTPVAPVPLSRLGGGRGSISGRVVLPSGQPVGERIRITLSTIIDPNFSTYTDNNGGFGFASLPEATYTLEVIGDTKLYEPITQEVRLPRGMHMRLTINLKERVKPGGSNTGAVVSAAELDPNVPGAAKKEFEKATKLAGEGKLQEAIERYKKALEIYSPYLMARNDLGVQYLKLKRYDEAAEQFGAAIELNPKAFNPRLNIGIVLVDQKKFLEALDHLRLATSLDSSSPSVHLYMGIATLETDDLDAAARELATAVSMGGPDYSVAHFHLAHLHMKRGEREEAIRELKTYLAAAPEGEYAERARKLLETLKQ